ncbi:MULTISPECIES: hypothetical protein [Streptomyces]|uniref:Heme exporter protein D n=1 Tax=Streptomyces drozdowiczii TaxID=202862 RepID=A0ABY6PST4_9ACTN|nr:MULTISPECIES: hypothetical protein [Streptomyces]MCX0245007.1 hypothetical protein [Streptomyces drozdowiczii]UZK55293.1 hypothetical protein NEH16_15210 [Streptomyces drozdowiczii]
MLSSTTLLSGYAVLIYMGALFVVVLVSVLAPSRERRADAHKTLGILVRLRRR